MAILAQLSPNNHELLNGKDEKNLDEHLKKYLDDKRYLIVLDDVWDYDFWDDYFKDRRRDKGSHVLLTTRIEKIALNIPRAAYFYMPDLNKVECWDLLRAKVFADKECPLEMEDAGKEIADKCEGLPLLVVIVAHVLP